MLTNPAKALTEPSTPALSTSTTASVSCAPGRMNTSSLKASAYMSARAAVVSTETRTGATRGMAAVPYIR